MPELLDIRGLETIFHSRNGTLHAVNGVSLKLRSQETLGIVGESGCGKSVTMHSLLRLIPTPPGEVVAGEAFFEGRDLLKVSDEEMRRTRWADISIVFQDPMTSFNPVLTVGYQLSEPLRIHKNMSKRDAYAQAEKLLTTVGIPNAAERLHEFPHQFSGGMRQRVMIAMALICGPKILVADEPTTALDVTIQAQIIEMVKHLRDEFGMAMIWITHDLGLIAGLAQRMAVMYAGYFVEEAPVKELYKQPQHPYTLGLLGSLPRLDRSERKQLVSIEGSPPVLYERPTSCPFAPRCSYRVERCLCENPPLMQVEDDHFVACWVDVANGKER